jgi:NADH dehydrogenase FAD-containing subunit
MELGEKDGMFHRDLDLLVIGGGFAGLNLFREIDHQRREVTLLTNRNHFLFSPLLPLAATGVVEIRSIVEPLRSFQAREGGDKILVGEAVDLDPHESVVMVQFPHGPETLKYRTLVIAAGLETATYGITGVEENCHFFKEMRDARRLREKILYQFDRASLLSGEERKRALRFIVVGAGPTGVELVCEIDDLLEKDLHRQFPDLGADVETLLLDSSEIILPVFDRELADYAIRKMLQKKIQIMTGIKVVAVEKDTVRFAEGGGIEAETIVWTAGVSAGPFIRKVAERLEVSTQRAGRIPVNDTLSLDLFPNIYLIGDCAAKRDEEGQVLPATAQVAAKEGKFLAKQLSGGPKTSAKFNYRGLGMLASLGSGAAIAEVGTIRLKGWVAWWFWKAAYLTRLVSWRNKVTVAFDWLKVMIFGRNTARID